VKRDYRGGTDYYGRALHLPTDHPDNFEGFDDEDEEFDDGDLTRCECVTGDSEAA
jgi:hypothetical protein